MDPSPDSTGDGGKRALRVLLVEEEPRGPWGLEDAPDQLDESEVQVERIWTIEGAIDRLSGGNVDLLLLDLDLPDGEDFGTFERISSFASDVPVVVLTRIEDEEMALSMVKAGAQDHLVKSEVTPELLRRTIRYGVERHRLISALRSLSLIDDLTGLYNRRGFTELGEQHLTLARRTGRAVVLVYMDLDDLKTINDTLGHLAGDEALMTVADVLQETFRQSDILARIGGDEFAVMALEASEENEEQLLERLQRRLHEVNQESNAPYRLSISAGAARFAGDREASLEDLLAEVDEAMYRDKWSKKGKGALGRLPPIRREAEG